LGNTPPNTDWTAIALTTNSTVKLYGTNVPAAPYNVRQINEYLATASSGTYQIDYNEWRGMIYVQQDTTKPLTITGLDLTFWVNSGLLNNPAPDLNTAVFTIGGINYAPITPPAASLVAVPEPASCSGIALTLLVLVRSRR